MKSHQKTSVYFASVLVFLLGYQAQCQEKSTTENTKPQTRETSNDVEGRVFGIHEIELKDDVTSEEFEKFVREKFAPSWPEFRNGLRIVVMKSDRGERKNKYAVVFLSESMEARDSLFPNTRPGKSYSDALAPSLKEWQELSTRYLAKRPGQVPYQSYQMISAAPEQVSEAQPNKEANLSRSSRTGFGFSRPGIQELRSISRVTTDADVKRILEQDDTNKDGKLGEGDNTRPMLSQNFARFDTNSDGFLDASEIKETGLRPHGGAVFLEAFDKNKDGFLTKDEAIYGPLAERFDRYDANKDRKLAEKEMDSHRGGMLFSSYPSRRTRSTANRGGFSAANVSQVVLGRFDRDGDEKLSKDEASTGRLLSDNFDELDTNEDGFLSSEELGRFREVAFPGQGVGRPRRNIFEESDQDGDGKLSKDELPEQFSNIDLETADEDEDGKLDDQEFSRAQRLSFASRFFQRMDQDNDGKLQRDEMIGRARNDFDQLDLDNSGFLTEAEFAKTLERNFASRSRSRTPLVFDLADRNRDGKLSKEEAGHPILTEHFAKFDADQDGFLSKDEHSALIAGTAEERATGSAKNLIERYDRNGDGELQENEFFANPFLPIKFSEVDRDANGSITVDECADFYLGLSNPEDAAKRAFARNDKNGDGKVTKDESSDEWQRIASFDTDQDGSITEAEFTLGEGKRKHEADVRRAGQRLLGLALKSHEKGLTIYRVTPGSPAYEAKVKAGDILLRLEGESVGTTEDLRKLVSEGPDEQTLTLIRDGAEMDIKVKFPTDD